ncbi:MAG: hypothetical protein ACYC3Q_12320 [Gemmatimonadaceae bacterium]
MTRLPGEDSRNVTSDPCHATVPRAVVWVSRDPIPVSTRHPVLDW